LNYRRLWVLLGLVLTASFLTLGYFGTEIYRQAPPIPETVRTADGGVLFTGQMIKDGQNVWQSLGGQQLGSVWGHGAYVAPPGAAVHRRAPDRRTGPAPGGGSCM